MAEEPKVTVPEGYMRNIEKKVDDLKLLIEVSTLLSSTLELDELMPLVMEKAKNVMDAEACSILFYNRETDKLEFEVAMCGEDSASEILKKTVTLDMGQGIAGWVAENRQPLIIDDVRKDNRFFQDADKITGFTTRGIIAVPLIGRSGLIGVAEVINPGKKDFDPEIFQLLCRQFAIAIENARYHKESIQRERLRQQLEIAASLQKSFLPESPVLKKGKATVSALNISASRVGGDIYDFIEPVDGTLGILIGDVSGKGISAALYMAKFISDFRHVSLQIDRPDLTLNKLNALASRAPMGMFLTAIYGILDLAKGNLLLSVAGHPPFIRISRGEATVTTVPSGPPLGIVPTEYPVTPIPLEIGDRLLFLTDGVFDAKNRGGERIGFEKIADFTREHLQDAQLVQGIVDYVEDFSKGTERADDLTLVELRWGT
ncbi:MAG: SpoIIE family protein phosphatase [Nitrospirae bacterium]|nr:SpoIIE family protein phosphatase [Nitrospirota bacterium]MCL5421894.1 SpoIIE family protein phosphatase [Nitrospirota bacterium]